MMAERKLTMAQARVLAATMPVKRDPRSGDAWSVEPQGFTIRHNRKVFDGLVAEGLLVKTGVDEAGRELYEVREAAAAD